MTTNHHHGDEDLGFIFIHDQNFPRKYLLDTGANRNLISSDQLSKTERKQINTQAIIRITGFNKTSPITYSLCEVKLQIHIPQHSQSILLDIMPPKTLNYNIIGVQAIQEHFVPFLLAQPYKQPTRQNRDEIPLSLERVHRTMKSILKSYQQPTLWPFFWHRLY